jgi:hypothetical protein
VLVKLKQGRVAKDEPFVGGLTVSEYSALPEEEQERLWNAEFAMDIDDFEEGRRLRVLNSRRPTPVAG